MTPTKAIYAQKGTEMVYRSGDRIATRPNITKAKSAGCTIPEIFENQARLTPFDPAVQFEDQPAVTFASLKFVADRIAAALPTSPGSIVPICMDISVDQIASIFGVLKSGAAYLLLDPTGSLERNQFMVDEVDAQLVITSRKYAEMFSKAVTVEDLLRKTSVVESPKTFIRDDVRLDSSKPAYIIYTSGTTGQPKGVSISHAAASHGINHFSLNGRSRWLLFFNPIFSAAQRTILATICKGGCLCLTSRGRLATSLPEVINEMRIDALGVTPSLFATLSPKDISPCLKQITTVGETVSNAVVEAWADVVELRVSYGLSECAQLNCSRKISKGDKPNVFDKPTDSTKAYILLPGTIEQAGVGQHGELCLAGPQLADGYLHRPAETAKSFTANPFGVGRMYRTGDLAAQLPDGSFEILGRIDHQIKIHGQRIEPEEIAGVLRQPTGVVAVAVLAAEIAGRKALVAAVVPGNSNNWSQLTEELRNLSRRMLPTYMVPSFWLELERLPLSANGKTDIKKIQDHAEKTPVENMLGRRVMEDTPEQKLQDDVELIIQRVWADILCLEPRQIGRKNSFFELGGSSIQAIQMINELRKQGIDLGSDTIFRQDDLATLRAEAIIQETKADLPKPRPIPFSMIEDEAIATSLREKGGLMDAYPATPLQESLVGLTLQGSTDYIYQRTFDIAHLDLIRLKLAFQVAFSRSDILRTTFHATEAGLFQGVRDDMLLPWKATESSLEMFKSADKQAGVQLGDPFVRVTVLNQAILVVTIHHALFDFWSSKFLFEDVSRLYNGVDLEPRAPFKNFVNVVINTDWQAAKQFWSEYLLGAAPTVLSFTSVSEKAHLSRSLSHDLQQIALSNHVTVSTVIYTAWAMVLSQHLASSDVTFATPLAGREIAVEEALRLDGPMLTVIPRRITLEKNAGARKTLERAHQESLKVLKHSQYGMRLALKAGGHGADLFDSMVNILPRQHKSFADLTSDVFLPHAEATGWQTEYTTLDAEQHDDHWEFRLTTEIEKTRAGFIIDQFVNAIFWLAKEPEKPIASAYLLSEAERHMLEASEPFPDNSPQLLHAGFELQARTHPWRIAIQWQDLETITYRRLDRHSNQLARFLKAQGLQRGDFACLLLEKSPMMIAAIMATLKLGVGYVPLAPENPVERNSSIVEEVKAKFILSESSIEQSIAGGVAPTIHLDSIDLRSCSATAISSTVVGTDTAYVIYTSGSTGRPKGVQVPHSAAAAAIESMIQVEKRRKGHWRSLQFSNYVFDASVLDIFNTLNSGGTLCMAPTEDLLSDLPQVINDMDVNHSFFTPTVARLLSPEDVPSLRTLTVGGEAVTADIMNTWNDGHRVIQAYGPTECAMVSTMRDMSIGDNPKNIGRPLPTVKAFVVERDGNDLVPYGAIGELCIAGPQLADGYLKRPDLTAAAFCPATIGSFDLMYRSGDLARWLPDGQLECLGRKDNQVKINGHRIELGEIEKAILATGTVLDCVTVVANIASKPQLAAFVIFEASEVDGILEPDAYINHVAALRNKLKGLAHYMYPKVVLPLGLMPRMTSGKTDRKLLATWIGDMDGAKLSAFFFDSFGSSQQIATVPTESGEQKLLEQAWIKLLGLPQTSLGQEANFLNLGGDSISAINLTSYARKNGYQLAVSDILMHSVLADMAICMKKSQDTTATTRLATFATPPGAMQDMLEAGLDADDIEYTYPCPPGQTEFLLQGARKEKMWVLMTTRPLDKSTQIMKWIRAVEQLTQTNDVLRTTFREIDGVWVGVVLKNPLVTVDIMDVADDREKMEATNAIWQSDFVFGKPFVRYAILRWPDDSMELVTKIDHGLYDGTSLRILGGHFRELQHGRPAPEHTPFRDFIFHLWRSDKEADLKFWTKNTVRPTTFQYPRIADPLADKSVIVASNLNIDEFSSTCGVTVPIVFQASFQLWVAKMTGQYDIEMDYLYTGRNIDLPNPQQINGVCCNFLPLKACVRAGQSVKQYLAQTQSDFWSATEHASVGLQEIYAAAGLDRSHAANRCLFLFQPFEAPPIGSTPVPQERPDMRWVYMAGVEVRMVQPYGLVCEVRKAADGYKIKFTFDERVFTAQRATEGAKEVLGIVERMLVSEEAGVRGLLSAY